MPRIKPLIDENMRAFAKSRGFAVSRRSDGWCAWKRGQQALSRIKQAFSHEADAWEHAYHRALRENPNLIYPEG
jgi:hypothetical protein